VKRSRRDVIHDEGVFDTFGFFASEISLNFPGEPICNFDGDIIIISVDDFVGEFSGG